MVETEETEKVEQEKEVTEETEEQVDKTPEEVDVKDSEKISEEKVVESRKEVSSSKDDESKAGSSKDDERHQKSEKEEKGKDNTIFVGIKPFMNYVTGVAIQFQNKGQDEVKVSARGKFISKAVDVVEVVRRTFLKEEKIKVDNINISSEQFENKEGRRIFVSAIEIRLLRG